MSLRTGTFRVDADSLAAEFLRAPVFGTRRAFSMEAVGDLGLEDVRMSEPVRLGEILPAVMQEIADQSGNSIRPCPKGSDGVMKARRSEGKGLDAGQNRLYGRMPGCASTLSAVISHSPLK